MGTTPMDSIAVERVAQAIFESPSFYGSDPKKPAWMPRENSRKQDEARGLARAAMQATPPAQPVAEGWDSDMERAPRDGRPVWLTRDGEVALASWMTSLEDGDGQWIIARKVGRDAYAVIYRDPTHWCPANVPPPPSDGAE